MSAVVKSGDKGKVEVGTGGEGSTLAVVKSGGGGVATVASAPSPSSAPWLTVGARRGVTSRGSWPQRWHPLVFF